MKAPVEIWILTERCSGESEAMRRVRQMQCADPTLAVLVRGADGAILRGLPMQFRVHNGSAGDNTTV